MLLANMKIAIIGGGPGGLTLARLLQMKGADVTVYERDINKDARVQGATLDLHQESGLAALKAAGLMDAFKDNYRPGADIMRVADAQANIVFDQHDEENVEDFDSPYFRPEIDRGPLRKILLGSLNKGTVVWDSYITSVEKTDNGWLINFRNGNSAMADIVIAADGANSKIRPLITPILPFYTGVTVVEGNIYDAENTTPRMNELVKGGKVFALGNEQTLVLSAKGDGCLSLYTGCKKPEHWIEESGIDFKDGKQVAAWFKKEYAGWSDVWQELFDNDKVSFTARQLYSMPLDQTWEAQSNITMLGDAAHLMPPYAGEGVNMAMQDALELANCLTSNEYKDIHTAIAAFETQMRTRASLAAKDSLDNTIVLHSKNGLQAMMDIFQGNDHEA